MTEVKKILDSDLAPFHKYYANGFYKKALKSLDNLDQKFPNNSVLLTLGGNCYFNLAQYKLAISCYDEAIRINPNNADGFNSKANALEKLRKFEEAISCATKAIEIKPDFDLAYYNLGINAMHLRLFDLSKKSFDTAIQLRPNFAKYKFSKSILFLLYGDFMNGWPLFESRWEMDVLFSPKLKSTRPIWSRNTNSKLLVWPEQGIGDQINYSSLLPNLNGKCSDLIVILDPRLINLYTRSMGAFCTFYPDNMNESKLDYDEHIAMGSLCQYFRANENDFESSRYGFLKDDVVKTAHIKKNILSIAPLNNKLCGISWGSSSKSDIHKTIPLKSFIELLDLKDYTYVSLQYGDTADEISEVRDELGVDIISYEEVDNFYDIDGLISLIQACDVVISVDNITCQLSGALGKKTHLLLTYGGGWWGWMADGSNSPWYHSVKIYRQNADENLSNLFLKLKEGLD